MSAVYPPIRRFVMPARLGVLPFPVARGFCHGALVGLLIAGASGAEPTIAGPAADFVDRHCLLCHDAVERKGNLDLEPFLSRPLDADALRVWTKVHDRVRAGEMPPKERPRRPDATASAAFVDGIAAAIARVEADKVARDGRAVKRRLNRYEYENALRDLLENPILSVRDALPEDTVAHGFNKVGEALDVSHVQIARYLGAADEALRSAIAPRIPAPTSGTRRYHTWQQGRGFVKPVGPQLRKTFPVVGHELQVDLIADRNMRRGTNFIPDLAEYSVPGREEQEAVVMLMSTYEPNYIRFERFRAPVTARYRLRFSGYTVWMSPDYLKTSPGRTLEPISIYAAAPRNLRKLADFDFTPTPSVQEVEVWLQAGETIQPDAVRLVRSRPPDFKNPWQEPDGMPGVAFQWMEVEGPQLEGWPTAGHRLLFGDLPLQEVPVAPVADAGSEAPKGKRSPGTRIEVVSPDPIADADRLMRGFIAKAFRRVATEDEIAAFLSLVHRARDAGFSFQDAMIAGYTAVLASPGFLYFQGEPGRLDGPALAERLAFFLWNSPPDATLRALAADGSLLRPEVLRAQVERLLDDRKSMRFVEAFLDYWLDLREMDASSPDGNLYPEYQLDEHLTESLEQETHLTFAEFLRRDLGPAAIVDADFAMLNGRLARHYGIPGVEGATLRPVTLPSESVRGGLLTQGSVLKVTANGTTTSPVLRGVWVMEKILGYHVPPPPPGVGAVESDTRGATTIREELAKHSSQASCLACHRTIDPPGFALESFDVMGAWRDQYRSVGEGQPVTGVGHNGYQFVYKLAQPVDASGVVDGAGEFADIRGFKQVLLNDPDRVARNVVEQFLVYATGAPVRFIDRPAIDRILSDTRASGHGLRSLIHALVQSEPFLVK